MFVSNSSFSAI